jgi:predicted HicB family RNase H-like nuclease
MDTKLTLKLNQAVIEKAKDFAKLQETSLSRLIENYLQRITDEAKLPEKLHH